MTATALYVARRDGWIDGRRVKAGEELRLPAGRARYEPVDPKPASEPAPRPPLRRRSKPPSKPAETPSEDEV